MALDRVLHGGKPLRSVKQVMAERAREAREFNEAQRASEARDYPSHDRSEKPGESP